MKPQKIQIEDDEILTPLQPKKANTDTPELIRRTHTDELVVALCGPIGSPLDAVATKLGEVLEQFGYETQVIKLSKFIEEKGAKLKPRATAFERIRHLIHEGNELRKNHGCGILTELGIAEICSQRLASRKSGAGSQESESVRFESRRICHVFNSIKNEQELEVLRLVYGDVFFCIGVFSPPSKRKGALRGRGISPTDIKTLIDQDSGEEIGNGQSVRKIFHQSDYFMKVDERAEGSLAREVRRFVNIITHSQIVTPTIDETAMYAAASAAVNSACLSRQVGACVTDPKGKVLGIGWNDAPRPGGGLYDDSNRDSEDIPDARCMLCKKCHNDSHKATIAKDLVQSLIEGKIFGQKKKKKATEIVLSSPIKDLIEFSRAVHAEMHAIINSAQGSGSQMISGRLYCTTYPCHNCARHIIAAGISRVIYIEPYRKSRAVFFHSDAIVDDESEASRLQIEDTASVDGETRAKTKKVQFVAFEGVAPRMYYPVFQIGKKGRKDDNGAMLEFSSCTAKPETETSLESFPVLESLILDRMVKKELFTE